MLKSVYEANTSYRRDVEGIFALLVTDIIRLIDDQVKSICIKWLDRGIIVRKCQ